MDYTSYRYDYSKTNDFHFALFSDLHIDSSGFAKAAFTSDADKYKKMGARFLFNGDLFDGILPTDKKRYSRGSDEFPEDAQVNARIDYALKILKPYVNNIDFIGIGNHEASIVKYDHVDLVKMLVAELSRLRDPSLPPIQRGGYQGFLRLWFHVKNGGTKQYVIYREHGKGGGSPVTKGTISLQRLHTTYIADLYWLGHLHTDIIDKTPLTIYPDNSGHIIRKKKRSIITAGYNSSFNQRDLKEDNFYRNSYPEENFLTPTGTGSAVLHITVPKTHNNTEVIAEITS